MELILEHPIVGHYVRNLKIVHPENYRLRQDQDIQSFEEVINECQYLGPWPLKYKERGNWYNECYTLHREVLLPVLLTLLPNISTLHLKCSTEQRLSDFVELFLTIAVRRRPSNPHKTANRTPGTCR